MLQIELKTSPGLNKMSHEEPEALLTIKQGGLELWFMELGKSI